MATNEVVGSGQVDNLFSKRSVMMMQLRENKAGLPFILLYFFTVRSLTYLTL